MFCVLRHLNLHRLPPSSAVGQMSQAWNSILVSTAIKKPQNHIFYHFLSPALKILGFHHNRIHLGLSSSRRRSFHLQHFVHLAARVPSALWKCLFRASSSPNELRPKRVCVDSKSPFDRRGRLSYHTASGTRPAELIFEPPFRARATPCWFRIEATSRHCLTSLRGMSRASSGCTWKSSLLWVKLGLISRNYREQTLGHGKFQNFSPCFLLLLA